LDAAPLAASLLPARLAAEKGRDVHAVPGSPLEPRSRGGNDLLRQGAAVCEGAEDVLRSLAGLAGLAEPDLPFEPATAAGPGLAEAAPETARDTILALLSPSPAPRDEIVRLSGLSTSEVNAALAELELSGRVVFTTGGGAALA
ncbi:MAG: DNA-protecting protein DprA, partial [Phenylobacterium sp.]